MNQGSQEAHLWDTNWLSTFSSHLLSWLSFLLELSTNSAVSSAFVPFHSAASSAFMIAVFVARQRSMLWFLWRTLPCLRLFQPSHFTRCWPALWNVEVQYYWLLMPIPARACHPFPYLQVVSALQVLVITGYVAQSRHWSFEFYDGVYGAGRTFGALSGKTFQ